MSNILTWKARHSSTWHVINALINASNTKGKTQQHMTKQNFEFHHGEEALPGTFDVSTVCTVGGEVGGTPTGCASDDFVGLNGCTGLILGLWAKFGL